MAKLENKFSWSFSAAGDFDTCRRKRYWSKYGSWGGWDRSAPPIQRKAYQLNKMDNIYSLQGQAAELAVMWVLREHQAGRTVDVEQAYEAIAKPFFGAAWRASRNGDWQANPKRFCCLREHYYKLWDSARERERADMIVEHTKKCISNFIERVLPRIGHVLPSQEVLIAGPGGGDPESFEYEGTKIYAIPDYVYCIDEVWHIHDWKAGKAKPEHANQLALYGLWAHQKHGVALDKICCYVEYLATGQVAPVAFTSEAMEGVIQRISESVADMSTYLVGADTARNVPVAQEEWDLTAEPQACSMCNFYELCKPELDAQ